MFQWYVVHTKPRAEHLAADNLLRQGFEVYLPRFRKTRRHARRIDTVISPLFPRYLFVGFDRQSQGWRPIASTRGVNEFVCQGDNPATVSVDIVEEIRSREDGAGLVRVGQPTAFHRGERVEVTAGAFCEQLGLFECRVDEERVVILMALLGRPVRVVVHADAIRRCN